MDIVSGLVEEFRLLKFQFGTRKGSKVVFMLHDF